MGDFCEKFHPEAAYAAAPSRVLVEKCSDDWYISKFGAAALRLRVCLWINVLMISIC